MTPADSIAVAVLIAARDNDERPLPRKWRGAYERFVRDGLLFATTRERRFRITGDGRARLAELVAQGVVPAEWVVVRGKAHDGAETGQGRWAQTQKQKRRAA